MPAETLVGAIRDVDLILTEGFKHGPWPKIALCREGYPLPLSETECAAVVLDGSYRGGLPFFSFDRPGELADYLAAF